MRTYTAPFSHNHRRVPSSRSQALHASAEEAVKQLTSQLRELQAGGSSAAQMAAAEAAALSTTVETLRREATLARDTIDAYEQVGAGLLGRVTFLRRPAVRPCHAPFTCEACVHTLPWLVVILTWHPPPAGGEAAQGAA